MKVTETICKTALSRSGIYGWTYTINPYRGCEHSCKYCFAPNILRLPRAEWGTELEVKKNIPIVLAKELKTVKPGLVGISSVTDPYQNAEEKYKVTRYCLEQLLKYKFPISIITKSPLVLRDIDLMKRFDHAEVTITITTLDEALASVLEPNAPPINERLKALTELTDHGIQTYAFLGPLLPSLEPQEVPTFMEQIMATGVKTVMVDTLNLKPGIWGAVANTLTKDTQFSSIKATFKNRLFNDKNYYNDIFNKIEQECNSHGVVFDH
jgi:DNA repair photolyase